MTRYRSGAGWVLGALGFASLAITTLHIVQPGLDPAHEPVSFYIHGAYGWLLPLALGAFGGASLVLGWALGGMLPGRSRNAAWIFGAGMLVTAIVPSDRWFPWQSDPSVSGVIHASVALIAPVVLLDPMIALARGRRIRPSRLARWLVVGYAASLVGSAASLIAGLALDRSPPWIGLAERLLALTAVGWLALTARHVRREGSGRTSGD